MVEARTHWVNERDAQLACGDCLELVPELARRLGPFELIYVDPPFNAGGKRRARKDRGERVSGEYAYTDAWGGLDAFLAMLTPRMECLKDALAEDGSLWVHLDHRAVHDAKVALDGIFGRRGFVGEIIWVPGNGSRRRRAPAVTHQTLLVYQKGSAMVWNSDAPELREPFAQTSQAMHFTATTKDGRRYRERRINGKVYRYFADQGRLIGSVWTDCPAMSANTPLRAETTGYPTQKPESLLRRIIAGASRPGAAVALGRRAAGCDLSPLACRLAAARVRKARAPAI